MSKPRAKKAAAEHLVRLDDATYRAIVQIQLEAVRAGKTRPTLGAVIASLIDRKAK